MAAYMYLGYMQEDLLHFIWKTNKLHSKRLTTIHGEVVHIEDVGLHNDNSGPDFFNAKLRIDGQLWAGNVEIHVKSSDWHAHNHSNDSNYDNVILHVVWEHDSEVLRKDGSPIPVLCLNTYIEEDILSVYESLFKKGRNSFINCDADIAQTSPLIWNNWLDRLFVERMEAKSTLIRNLLKVYQNDWERVLFILLFKNFGSKINGPLFLEVGRKIDFHIVRKLIGKPLQMEALFMGMAGLLQKGPEGDSYYLTLQEEFLYLAQKFDLRPVALRPPEFFKLRPANFPTIRLAQLANFYAANHNIFHRLVNDGSQHIKVMFQVALHPYWENHYNFGKESPKKKKSLSSTFIDLIIINTIFPLRFCYLKQRGLNPSEVEMGLLEELKAENNGVLKKYARLQVVASNAKESQALLQLYQGYCTQNKCLQCAVGAALLNIKS
jgi:hypothetical protein